MRRAADPRGLTVEEIRRLFRYEPETGHVYWRVKRSNVVRLDRPAGCPDNHGYLSVRINKKLYKVHHLVWVLTKGVWPTKEIDHWDRDTSNNREHNLREATSGEQKLNRNPKNQTGYKGVHKTSWGKFESYIWLDKSKKHLGFYYTAHEAATIYDSVASRHGILTNRELGRL
jgi:hypothetical protein